MKKFTKKDRSTWPYFWAHWFAFQMTAITLGIWKFRYLFHDWYKPWLKMFGWKYGDIQYFHRHHSKHHLEYLTDILYYNDGGNNRMSSRFNWDELIIDWQCSMYTKEACPRGAYKEMERYREWAKDNMTEEKYTYLCKAFDTCMKPRLNELNLND